MNIHTYIHIHENVFSQIHEQQIFRYMYIYKIVYEIDEKYWVISHIFFLAVIPLKTSTLSFSIDGMLVFGVFVSKMFTWRMTYWKQSTYDMRYGMVYIAIVLYKYIHVYASMLATIFRKQTEQKKTCAFTHVTF